MSQSKIRKQLCFCGEQSENRHAYLIMAHNEFEILEELLKDLDHERNDVYIHIDRKVKTFPENRIMQAMVRGNLYNVKPIRVNWGGYSQIACELLLMENAVANGPYAYYHFLTGVNYPLKSQDQIHEFFDKHQGVEFVGFDKSKDYDERIRYIHLFNEIGKVTTLNKKLLCGVRNKFIDLQKRLRYYRKYPREYCLKKGLAYWSITEDAVHYLLSQKALIRQMFRYSLCGDEMFVQTILFNSELRYALSSDEDEFDACLRDVKPILSWGYTAHSKHISEREIKENVFTHIDIDYLLSSKRYFAMKFGGPKAVELLCKFRSRRDM